MKLKNTQGYRDLVMKNSLERKKFEKKSSQKVMLHFNKMENRQKIR